MENNDLRNAGNLEIGKNQDNFDYLKKSKLLIRAGIVGVVLSLLYLVMRSMKMAGSYPPPFSETLPYGIYYLFNSLIVLSSGFFLKNKKKFGLLLFRIVIISMIISFLVPGQGVSYNLFLYTLAMAGLGIVWIIPTVGTIYFFYCILVNLFNIGKWRQILRPARDALK